MIPLLERVEQINHRKLVEGSREDILRSFFSLVKTNGGRFKSPKQAEFLKSQTEDGIFHIVQILNFGTSSHSQRKVDWTVVVDDQGVVKITKRTGSKGEELYWDRTGQSSISSKNKARDEANKEHKRADIQAIIVELQRELEVREDEVEKAKRAIDNPAAASVRDYLISRLPHYEEQAQQIRDMIAKHEATLQSL